MITLLLLVRATYMNSDVLHAHPVRGESHIQHNTTGEVATIPYIFLRITCCITYVKRNENLNHVVPNFRKI